ncbi:MAG TPA: hypothetical protein VE861_06620 [Gemmatimonadaceae bacterium]|nr:hypothetical protein [Gemmatimonadaceae bacterium]
MTTDVMVTPSEAQALRLHEKIEGEGIVPLDAEFTVSVHYSLKDVEELHRIGSTDVRTDGRPGARTVFGLLRGASTNRLAPHIGARLRLRMADGRTLQFTIAKVLGDTLLIQGLGGFQ